VLADLDALAGEEVADRGVHAADVGHLTVDRQ
jgi:hypothetical protein